jgi:hypothetical protein
LQADDASEIKATLSLKLRVAGARIRGIQSQTGDNCGVSIPAEDPCATQNSLRAQLATLDQLANAAEDYKQKRLEVSCRTKYRMMTPLR